MQKLEAGIGGLRGLWRMLPIVGSGSAGRPAAKVRGGLAAEV